jgi:hypothetical protein
LPRSFVKQGMPLFLPFACTIDIPDPIDQWGTLMRRFQLQRISATRNLLQIHDWCIVLYYQI